MASKLECFDSNGDFLIFYERLEIWFKVNKVDDEQKANYLLTSLSTEVYKLLRNAIAPKPLNEEKYADLVKVLKAQFVKTTIVYKERRRFYEAKQIEGEKSLEFYNRLKALAINCEFKQNIDCILLDRFVSGIAHGPVFERICEESKVTMERCLELAQSREVDSNECHKIYNHHQNVPENMQNKNWRQQHHQQPQNYRQNDVQHRHNHSGSKCKACGRGGHNFARCRYKQYRCSKCKKMGHLAVVCGEQLQRNHLLETDDTASVDIDNDSDKADECLNLFSIDSACNNVNVNFRSKPELYWASLVVNGEEIKFEVDTGSAISAVPYECYIKKFSKCKLKPYLNGLKSYNGTTINTCGYIEAKVVYSGKQFIANFVIVQNGCRPLIGRDVLNEMKFTFEFNSISVTDKIEKLILKFNDVFDGGLGKYVHSEIKLKLKNNAMPKFVKPRPVPFAFKPKLEKELNRLEELGVIHKIDNSKWGTPLVTVLKKDGSLRVCADYSVTINKCMEDVNYPLPRIEDLFQALQGGCKFSKIDLMQAYNQLVVDKETSEILTWSTHKGLYAVKRLPFGCKPNSAIFQSIVDSVLLGCSGTVAFIDDIVITGKDDEEHLKNVEEVFERLNRAGFKVNRSKCEFLKSKITYLGFVIDSSGLHKSKEKIRAIAEMPNPTDRTQVRAVCGLINYYSRFLQNLSPTLRPIYQLLSEDKFNWSVECDKAFAKVKEMITSDVVLMHYNPALPIILTTDASKDGIGACLAHVKGNQEHPIAFASRTLNKAETGYSMVDKEALGIFFGVVKFQQYLIGRRFTIRTDHKPLVAIFGEKKGIPVMAAGRLQRWATFLSSFDFGISYIPGKENGCADALSRLSRATDSDGSAEECSYLNLIGMDFQKPINFDDVAKESENDENVSEVILLIKNGWPRSVKKCNSLQGYFVRRNELTIEQGVVMWGHRVVIPKKFRKTLLEEVHSSHLGIVKAKALVRSFFWWPGIDKELEMFIKSCHVCRVNQRNPPKVEVVPWPKSSRPFQRIHLDYCGPIKGNNFLVVIDTYTKWLEVVKTKLITTEKTIQMLKPILSRFGIPSVIVSDNATSFTSCKFKQFCQSNGIDHVTSPAYHPASNGQAENSVKTFKFGFCKMIEDPKNINRQTDDILESFLYMNRNAVHSETGRTPFELMFERNPPLRWEKLLPNRRQRSEVESNVKNFKVNDKVYMKNFNNDKWRLAKIVQILGVNSYLVEYEGKVFKRHANHLSSTTNNNDNISNNEACKKGVECSQNNLKQVLMESVKMGVGTENIVQGSADVAEPILVELVGQKENENTEHVNNESQATVEQIPPVAGNDAQNNDGKRAKRQIKKPIRLDL